MKSLLLVAVLCLFSVGAADGQLDNYGLEFNGDNYIYLNKPATTQSSGITISFNVWANYTRIGSASMVIAANGVPGTSGVAVVILPNSLGLGLQIGATTYSFGVSLQRARWTFVSVVSPSAGIWKLFLDAIEVAQLSTATITPVARFYVGGQSTNSRAFIGYVDSVQVWNVPRTVSQLQLDQKEEDITGFEPGLALFMALNDRQTPPTFAGSISSSAVLAFNGPVAYVPRGTRNSALRFRGDSYLYLTKAIVWPTYTMSCHVWVESTRPSNYVVLLSNGVTTTSGAALVLLPDYKLALQVNKTTYPFNVELPRMQWTFVSVAGGSSPWSLYIDAVLAATISAPAILPAARTYVGGDSIASRLFIGAIDNVQFWAGKRNSTQLRGDMIETESLDGRELGLLLYLPFNDQAVPPTRFANAQLQLGPTSMNGETVYVPRDSLPTGTTRSAGTAPTSTTRMGSTSTGTTSTGTTSTGTSSTGTTKPLTTASVATTSSRVECPSARYSPINYPGTSQLLVTISEEGSASAIRADCTYFSHDEWLITQVLPANTLVVVDTCTNVTDVEAQLQLFVGSCSEPVACNIGDPDFCFGFFRGTASLVMPTDDVLFIRVGVYYGPPGTIGVNVYTERADKCPQAQHWPISQSGITRISIPISEATRPSYFPVSCGPNVWRDTWLSTPVLPANTIVTVDTCGTGTADIMDSALEVFIGNCSRPIGCNDEVQECGLRSELRFVMPTADRLFIRVTAYPGFNGNLTLAALTDQSEECPQARYWPINTEGSSYLSLQITESTPQSDFAQNCGWFANIGRDLWLLTPILPSGSNITIDNCGPETDLSTMVQAFAGGCYATSIACTMDSSEFCSGHGGAAISFRMMSDRALFIRVAAYSNSTGNVGLRINIV